MPQTWPEEAIDKIQQLEQENRDLRIDLDKYIAKVMKLQGENDQLTDFDINDRFGKLYDSIHSWIRGIQRELRPQGWNFKEVFHKACQDEYGRRFLMQYLFGKKDTAAVTTNSDIARLEWLGRHSTCVYVVLSRLIWTHLESQIFHDRFPLGVPQPLCDIFEDIMEAMKTMKAAGEGEVASNKWKSETMTLFVRTKTFQQCKSGLLAELTNDLSEKLIKWPFTRDFADLSSHLRVLGNTIIKSASDLHQDMACSRFQYTLEAPPFSREELPAREILSQWNLKNINQWIEATSDDEIIGVFNCLFPGIYRLGIGDEERVEVVKPVVLVYDEPSPPHPASHSPSQHHPKRSPSPNPTHSVSRTSSGIYTKGSSCRREEEPPQYMRPPKSRSQSLTSFPPNSGVQNRSSSKGGTPIFGIDRAYNGLSSLAGDQARHGSSKSSPSSPSTNAKSNRSSKSSRKQDPNPNSTSDPGSHNQYTSCPPSSVTPALSLSFNGSPSNWLPVGEGDQFSGGEDHIPQPGIANLRESAESRRLSMPSADHKDVISQGYVSVDSREPKRRHGDEEDDPTRSRWEEATLHREHGLQLSLSRENPEVSFSHLPRGEGMDPRERERANELRRVMDAGARGHINRNYGFSSSKTWSP